MKIGLLKEEYPEKRCITFHKENSDIKYILTPPKQKKQSKPIRFCLRVRNHIKWRLGIKNAPGWNQSAWISGRSIVGIETVDLLHTFNTIPDIGNKPWCCTFESEVPVTTDLIDRPWEKEPNEVFRFSNISRRLLNLCAMENCRGLIAISTAAFKVEEELIRRSQLGEREKEAILHKLVCIHPPQRLLITEEELQSKFCSFDSVTFILVGHDYFRKGGWQVLRALNALYEKGMRNFKLILVSKMVYIGDHTNSITENDYNEVMKMIDRCDWIEHYQELPNEKVLELMKKSHIGLLPSLDETYGYSALELQAAGCACVTTNISALGEINSNECGWLCDIKPNRFGQALYGSDTEEKKARVRERLQAELDRVFTEILENPSMIHKKALSAVQRIKENHDPDRIQRRINEVYGLSVD